VNAWAKNGQQRRKKDQDNAQEMRGRARGETEITVNSLSTAHNDNKNAPLLVFFPESVPPGGGNGLIERCTIVEGGGVPSGVELAVCIGRFKSTNTPHQQSSPQLQ